MWSDEGFGACFGLVLNRMYWVEILCFCQNVCVCKLRFDNKCFAFKQGQIVNHSAGVLKFYYAKYVGYALAVTILGISLT